MQENHMVKASAFTPDNQLVQLFHTMHLCWSSHFFYVLKRISRKARRSHECGYCWAKNLVTAFLSRRVFPVSSFRLPQKTGRSNAEAIMLCLRATCELRLLPMMYIKQALKLLLLPSFRRLRDVLKCPFICERGCAIVHKVVISWILYRAVFTKQRENKCQNFNSCLRWQLVLLIRWARRTTYSAVQENQLSSQEVCFWRLTTCAAVQKNQITSKTHKL